MEPEISEDPKDRIVETVELASPININSVVYNSLTANVLLCEDPRECKIKITLNGVDAKGVIKQTPLWCYGDAPKPITEDNAVGKTAKVQIASLPGSSEMDAVVDTGATICSLHADSFVINNDRVKFICKALSPNTITMDMAGSMPVRSPDGAEENRPSIKVDLMVDGKEVPGVLVNLNNRSNMTTPFLLGMNALQSGDFVVDPNAEQQT